MKPSRREFLRKAAVIPAVLPLVTPAEPVKPVRSGFVELPAQPPISELPPVLMCSAWSGNIFFDSTYRDRLDLFPRK